MPGQTKRSRLNEVFNWLQRSFPVRRHCTLFIKKIDKDFLGYVLYDSEEVHVYIDKRLPLYAAIECLLHEWAHVKSRRVGHGVHFLKWLHEIEEEFWKWKKLNSNS